MSAGERLGGVEVVSFDLDGTLYELPRLRAALRRLALGRLLGAPLATPRELRRLARLRAAMEAVRRAGGDLATLALSEPREALAALEERWYVPAARLAGPRPGLRELLGALRARGVRAVVLSDHPAASKLEALGLAGAFERVYVGEALGALKPSPAPFRALLADLGLAPGALLHVGDRADTDGAGGAAAGVRTVIVPPGPITLEQLLA
jgi:phosphoglycolate phosphatase